MSPENSDYGKIQDLLNQGAYFHAHNLAKQIFEKSPENSRVRQLFALSLLRLGKFEDAREVLLPLYAADPEDSETSGLLARTYKDAFFRSGHSQDLEAACDIYQRNFSTSNSYYTGINAATLTFLLGKKEDAQNLAAKVIGLIREPADYWSLATLGEAYVLKEDHRKALESYREAIALAEGNWGMLNSTRQQLSLLSDHISGLDPLIDLFGTPTMAVFTGHMIDHPGRDIPRFPPAIEPDIYKSIKSAIAGHGIDIGYSSIACGADILFIEAMEEAGKEVRLYLPFSRDDFIKSSIAFAGKHWLERFNRIMQDHEIHYVTEEGHLGDDELFQFMGKVIMGHCLLNADIFSAKSYLLSVLADRQRNQTGGTYDLVNMWPGTDSININPAKFRPVENKKGQNTPVVSNDTKSVSFDTKRAVRYILFADIVGFSRIDEESTPYFVPIIFQKIADILGEPKPDVINTWGDAIFLADRDADTLMQRANAINKVFQTTNWTQMGLPKETSIRIALHAGPVFLSEDPITSRPNLYGTHVNKAARMEPVTLPGSIYVSEQFAAALRVETGNKYKFTHVGIIDLPKNFGRQEIYMIHQ